jgi:hypothetical protein
MLAGVMPPASYAPPEFAGSTIGFAYLAKPAESALHGRASKAARTRISPQR